MSQGGDKDASTELPNASLNERNDSQALREKIETALQEVISPEQRKTAVMRVEQLVKAESFRGPLPPPRYLAQYDKVIPGLAERIVRMAEAEQGHRHHCEDKIIEIQTTIPLRG